MCADVRGRLISFSINIALFDPVAAEDAFFSLDQRLLMAGSISGTHIMMMFMEPLHHDVTIGEDWYVLLTNSKLLPFTFEGAIFFALWVPLQLGIWRAA